MNRLLVLSLLSFNSLAAEIVTLDRIIALPKVEGRIDHLAIDVKTKRVFIAALGNNTVEVVDLNKGERIHTITGLDEPQGIAYIPELNQVVVASGGDGSCRFYDTETFKLVKTVDLKGDADNVRYEPASRRIYVGHVSGALATIDLTNVSLTADVKLGDHPESFQLETKGDRIFVNVPKTKKIEVVDRKKNEVVAKWQIKGAHSNYPMTLDEENHRLLVGCRAPAKILVFDAETGIEAGAFDCVGDVDDIFFDANSKRLYAIGGDGKLDVFTQADANSYKLESEMKTSAGARTGLFVPELKLILVAAPHRNNDNAELRCYKVN